MLHVKAPLVLTLQVASAAVRIATPASQLRQEPGPATKSVRHRSHGIAILLAVLSISFVPLSLHNFYLGHYGRGALALALLLVGVLLVSLGITGSVLSGSGLMGIGYVGVAVLAGWFIWQLSDLARVITKELAPKDGEYNSRLFQTHPD